MTAGGSLAWTILRNDLRLYWRGGPQKKRARATGLLGRIGILLLLHLAAFGLLAQYADDPAPRGGPELAALVVLLLCAMAAVHRALEVLYNRGDLALLLASPVPARTVLATRLTDVAVTSVLGSAALMLPIVDTSILLFGWRWAWAFPVWICTTLAIAPLAVLLTLSAVERLGVRRARLAVQMLGIVFGMGAVLIMQLPHWLADDASRAGRRAARQALRADLLVWFDRGPLRQLVEAAHGDWRWLPPLLLAAVLLFVVAGRALARRFVEGAQGAVADTGGDGKRATGPAAAAWAGSFRRPPHAVHFRTQLLLLRRDPLLLTRCAMQIVSLVPMLFGAMMLQRTAGIGGVGLMAAGIVPVTLAALLNAGDEAHEFVVSSPTSPYTHARARARAAAAMPLLFAWTMAAVVLVLAAPLPAALVAIGGTVQALASGWLGTCTTRPHSAEERARNRPPRVAWQTLVTMVAAGFGMSGIGLVDSGRTLAGSILFGIGLTGAALLFLVRPRPGLDQRPRASGG